MGAEETEEPTAPIANLLKGSKEPPSAAATMLAWLTQTTLRANALFDLEDMQVMCPRDARAAARQEGTQKPFKTRLSLVSLPISIQPTKYDQCHGGDLHFERFDHFDVCIRHPSIEKRAFDDWCQNLLMLYRKAAQGGAEIICTNELGFPSFWTGRAPVASRYGSSADFSLRFKELQRQKMTFEENLQEICTEYSCIILPGTYHDPFSFENVAPVFFPHPKDTYYSRKYTSAHSAGEYIKVSRSRKIPVYTYGSLVFCVLICSDAFDLNIFFRYVIDRMGPDKGKNIDIFFVPSYYKQRDPGKRNAMLDACRQLSAATGSTVVFVDHFVGAERKCKAIFICGDEVWTSPRKNAASYTLNWRNDVNRRLRPWSEIRHKAFGGKF